MDNQHRKIKGYRELTQEEIDLMNEIKQKGIELRALVNKIESYLDKQHDAVEAPSDEYDRLVAAESYKWVHISETHLQEGLMALTRSVAQPGFF